MPRALQIYSKARKKYNREENDTKKAILNYLTLKGHIAIRINSGKIFMGGRCIQLAPEGTADIVGCHKATGQFFAIEVKKFGEKMSQAQHDFMIKVDSIPRTISLLAFSVQDVIEAGF